MERTTKYCSKCKEQKLLPAFGKSSSTKDGLQNQCKLCRIKNRGAYAARELEYGKKYYKLHRLERLQYAKNHLKTIRGLLSHRFQCIKSRCTNPKNKDYGRYGGRGIKCLFKSGIEFVDYILNELQLNPRGLDIDRINNDGHYERGNIRLVTHKENCNNRRGND